MHDRGANERPCSECGLSVRERVERRWPRRRVLLVQVGLIAVALIWLGWRVAMNWPAVKVLPATAAGMQGGADFPSRRFTAEDLERIAAGDANGADILNGVYDYAPRVGQEHAEIAAKFGPAKGSIFEKRVVGWPTPWLIDRLDGSAEDVYTGEGGVAFTSPLMDQTMWTARRRVHHSVEGPRRRVSSFVPEAFGGVLLVLLLGWQIGRGARWIGFKVRPNRSRRWSWSLPLAGLGSAAVLVAWLSVERAEPPHLLPIPFVQEANPTGLRFSQLDESPQSPQRLARAILDAVGDDRDGVLMVGGIGRADMSQIAWTFEPWPSVSGYRVAYSEPSRGLFLRVLWNRESVAVIRGRAVTGGTVAENVSMRTRDLLNLALAGVLLWQLPVFAGFVAGRVAERRGRRRLGRGLCVNCGYPAPERE